MSDIPELNPYNPAEPFIKMKLEGSIIDRLAEAGIPAMRALKYFHENPEGKATTFFSMLADDFVPFKYQIQSGQATPSSLAKEAILMAMPTREGKAAERSMYQPRDPNKRPIELSNRPIEADPRINDALNVLDELETHDSPYHGGPGIIDWEGRPYDLYGSEYVNLDEAKDHYIENGTGYNELLEEFANEEDLARTPDGNYYDYRQHKLDPEDVAKYDEAAETFRNAINQADYNDIIIGERGGTKSAQDLVRAIDNGEFKLSDYEINQILTGHGDIKDIIRSNAERKGYSITQKDLDNIADTYDVNELVGSSWFGRFNR